VVEHFNVGLLEQVCVLVFLVPGADKEGIDPEEGAELLIEVDLLDVGSGGWRHPQFLGVAL
jgi:hypothetical protein